MKNYNNLLETSPDQIQAAIKQMHESGKGDYQTIMRQVNKAHKGIELNLMQRAVALHQKKYSMLVSGRGVGKTTVIGMVTTRYSGEMPKSVGAFICPSYDKALNDILPSLTAGLAMFGLYENLHYFIGKQPPRAWRNTWGRAYQEPKKYEKFISFWNGMRIRIVSHTIANDGKGTNTDWIVGDEAALLDVWKLQENTRATLRGTNKYAFKKSKYWGSEFYATSMPITQAGIWVLEWLEKAKANPEEYIYFDFPTAANAHNLMEGYIEAGRKMAEFHWMFEAEYLNIKPNISQGGFYGMLNESVHGYQPEQDFQGYTGVSIEKDSRRDTDCDASKTLLIGMDFGADINCLAVLQLSDDQSELRAINAMHTLGDEQKLQEDLINDFINYYKHHRKKVVKFWYDNTGNNKTGFTRYNRAEQVRKQLVNAGWQVQMMTKGGSNPLHARKHMVWENILNESEQRNPKFPIFRINLLRARSLFNSMFHAKTRLDRNGKTAKDKSSEKKKKTIKPQDATHYSDAIDSPIFGLYERYLHFVQGIRTDIS